MKNKEIKSSARGLLQGKFGSFILLFLAAYVLQSLIVSIPSTLLNVPDHPLLFLSQIILSVLLEALGAMILLGVSRGALLLSRGRDFSLMDLFFAFRNQGDHFLALELILTVISTVTYIPGYIFIWMYGNSSMSNLEYMVISYLFSALSTVLTFLFTLVFSMSEYIMLDHPYLSAGAALKASVRMMKGHVGQYLLLILSFLGLLILGYVSLGIGLIWVLPYMAVSEAVFYNSISGSKAADDEQEAAGYTY